RFALIVHHDDAEREWAYDRNSQIGKLDKAWDEAKTKRWTVVSMKNDWNTIFPEIVRNTANEVGYRAKEARKGRLKSTNHGRAENTEIGHGETGAPSRVEGRVLA